MLATVRIADSVPGVLFVVGNVDLLARARHWVLIRVCGVCFSSSGTGPKEPRNPDKFPRSRYWVLYGLRGFRVRD